MLGKCHCPSREKSGRGDDMACTGESASPGPHIACTVSTCETCIAHSGIRINVTMSRLGWTFARCTHAPAPPSYWPFPASRVADLRVRCCCTAWACIRHHGPR
jgi:hypothetical protein